MHVGDADGAEATREHWMERIASTSAIMPNAHVAGLQIRAVGVYLNAPSSLPISAKSQTVCRAIYRVCELLLDTSEASHSGKQGALLLVPQLLVVGPIQACCLCIPFAYLVHGA